MLLVAAAGWLGPGQALGQGQPKVYKVGQGRYATLTEALAEIPTTLDQSYELHIVNGAILSENVLINKVGTASRTLVIKPDNNAANTQIQGTITLSGAHYVTLSGANNVGSQQLSVVMNNAPDDAEPALVLTNDARNNTISGVRLLGNNTITDGGVVELRRGASSVGNDNNSFTGNYFGNISSTEVPANLVYVGSMSAASANDNVTFSNNEFDNFSAFGLSVGTNNNAWTITNNSFYHSLSAVAATRPATGQTALSFRGGTNSNSNTITGNVIGGTAAEGNGGVWTNTGTDDFIGMTLSWGTNAALPNVVANNVAKNINLSSSSSGQSFKAIEVVAGRAELGNNTVSTVVNNGSSGVNSLFVRGGTVVVASHAVPAGQLLSVAGGTTTVLNNLAIAGNLVLTAGKLVFDKDFTTSSRFTQTGGILDIKGNLYNYGAFISTLGAVQITGNGNQLIGGGTYYNLEVLEQGTKTLIGDVIIGNKLTLSKGIVATDENTSAAGQHKIVLPPLASIAETTTSYVLGTVEAARTLREGSTEDFGSMGFALAPASGSVVPSSAITVTRITGTAPISNNGNRGILRYFNLTSANAAPSGMRLNMRVEYANHELAGQPWEEQAFFRSANGSSPWQPKGVASRGTTATGYFATLDGADALGYYALATFQRPLPVGLTAFSARRQQQTAVLTWATATELNNRGFAVEVSADGQHYRELGFVAAPEGNSATARNYRYVDTEPGKQGTRYYRLRQLDHDGKVAFYGPQVVSFGAGSALAAFPTAFDNSFEVELTAPAAGIATFTLTDLMGRVVWAKRQEVTAGLNQLQAAPNCRAGSYVLTATLNGQRYQQRVVRK
ncbi:hypothetical protein ASU33_00720 [Solirubrum puertoriconensis]|uniref:Secretion system C-terminal sorting domain-containing protein n=2 Tax=Solirubrum puertoriconensis TaxID=1751427 RepID=A0A9X0HHF1_SOLP1|nr:hypothetical protein ASU33_00720 [Solirubrum puertoriconensis]